MYEFVVGFPNFLLSLPKLILLLMATKKQSSIQICDAKLKGAAGFRVKSVGKNSEVLQTSEVLESVKAVKIHIAAMRDLYSTDTGGMWQRYINVPVDRTKGQKFLKDDFATSGLKK
jgi:hypothetical protein